MIYLIFNEGYSGRVDLAAEAIRLGRVLAALMPDEPEVQGLLALMLCHDARRAARFSGEDLVLLEDQDRSLWNDAQVEEGRSVVERALALGGRGPYVLQAAIASLQTEPSIRQLYSGVQNPFEHAPGIWLEPILETPVVSPGAAGERDDRGAFLRCLDAPENLTVGPIVEQVRFARQRCLVGHGASSRCRTSTLVAGVGCQGLRAATPTGGLA